MTYPDKLILEIGPQGSRLISTEEPVQTQNLTMVDGNDPVLHEPCQPANLHPGRELSNQSLVECMLKVCFNAKGYGLSANQLGVSQRIFVLDAPPELDNVYFNPQILTQSDDSDELEEGCLSFPYVRVKVKRPLWVILQWFNIHGEVKKATFHGMTARVICHEMDHLNGVTILDHVTPFEARRAREKASKLTKKLARIEKREKINVE